MDLNQILVTVVVPIYNAERYLAECIDSILSQDHQNLNIILINDGSEDQSGKIAEEYQKKDARICVIHRENSGVSITRNVGIDAAKGEYICFSDADDKLEPDYVSYLLKLAVENDADMSITRNFHNSFRQMNVINDILEIQTPEEAIVDLLHYQHMIGVYCKMIKTSFLNEYKLRFMSDIRIGEGFNFTMDCFQRINKLAVGQRSVYFYRRDNEASAMSHFNVSKVYNAILAMHRMNERLIFRTSKILRAWEFAMWHTYSDMWIFMVHGKAEKEYPDLYKECMHYMRAKAYYALIEPVSFNEKVRSLILMCIPKLYTYLVDQRQKKFNQLIER